MSILEAILRPSRIWSCEEALAGSSAAPELAGVYGWFFREIPGVVPVSDCVVAHGATLLYVGIAAHPRKPSSKATLRSRLRTHYRGNAAGSTLRLTLGCLLEDRLGIRLRQSASGRMTFGDGEACLSAWMESNALVAWVPTDAPSDVEHALLRSIDLPLNIEDNQAHPFHATLTGLRSDARRRARNTGSATRRSVGARLADTLPS